MTDRGAAFISELIRAANETAKLTNLERARLLERAAATLRDYRHEINYSKTPANDGGLGDIAQEWSEIAMTIELFSTNEVSKTLLNAVAVIKAARVLLEIKRDIQRDD